MRNSIVYMGKHEQNDTARILNAYQRALDNDPKWPTKRGPLFDDITSKKLQRKRRGYHIPIEDSSTIKIDDLLTKKHENQDYEEVIRTLFDPDATMGRDSHRQREEIEFLDEDDILVQEAMARPMPTSTLITNVPTSRIKSAIKRKGSANYASAIAALTLPQATDKPTPERKTKKRQKVANIKTNQNEDLNNITLHGKACIRELNKLNEKAKKANNKNRWKVKSSHAFKNPIKLKAIKFIIGIGLCATMGLGWLASVLASAHAASLQEEEYEKIVTAMYDVAEEAAFEEEPQINPIENSIMFVNRIEEKQKEIRDLEEQLNSLEPEIKEPTREDKINYIMTEFELSWDQFITLVAVVRQEAGPSYEEAYNVISNIFLRTIDSSYAKEKTPAKCFWAQITREGQYVAYYKGHYKKHLATIEDSATMDAVLDFFCTTDENGKLIPSHNYLNFGAHGTTGVEGAVRLSGANDYYNSQSSRRKLDYNTTTIETYFEEAAKEEYEAKKAELESALEQANAELEELYQIEWEEGTKTMTLSLVKSPQITPFTSRK